MKQIPQNKYVCDQAELQCSCGSQPGKLKVASQQFVFLQERLQATSADNQVVPGFGSCSAQHNQPCTPALLDWRDVATDVTLAGAGNFLLEGSSVTCSSGGKITIRHGLQQSTAGSTDLPYYDLPVLPLRGHQRMRGVVVHDGVAVNERTETDEGYQCAYCSEPFTAEQLQYIAGAPIPENTLNGILPLLNAYRQAYKLDTCLRKAHFLAQVMAESGNFTVWTEGLNYKASALRVLFKGRFKPAVLLKDFLTISRDGVIIEGPKAGLFTADEIRNVIAVVYHVPGVNAKKDIIELYESSNSYDNVTLDEADLYGRTNGNITLYKDKLLKVILKAHDCFRSKWPSRAYANKTGNGNELSQDGYKFRGRGLIQITGRDTYAGFSAHRNENPFPGDATGKIDFTEESNYDRIGNNEDPLYTVQSAVYFWAVFKRGLIAEADRDDILCTSQLVNGGYNHLGSRNEYIKKARTDNGMKVYAHYRCLYEHGTTAEKEYVIRNLRLLSQKRSRIDSATRKIILLKDNTAERLLKELVSDQL